MTNLVSQLARVLFTPLRIVHMVRSLDSRVTQLELRVYAQTHPTYDPAQFDDLLSYAEWHAQDEVPPFDERWWSRGSRHSWRGQHGR